jgi:hypothetical protein
MSPPRRRHHRHNLALAVLLALSPASGAMAQPTQPAPAATTSGAVQHLRATVTGVQGTVRVRLGEGQPLQPAVVGMEIGEDAELITNPKSAVQFSIPGGHTITIDRLSKVKLLEAINAGGKMKTEIGMEYGRTQYDIEVAGREHESSIVTPSSTLAVRGTQFVAYDQRPFPARGISLTGRVEFRDFKKRTFVGSEGGDKAVVTTDNPNAPSFALTQSVVDPGARLARTDAENQLVNTLLSSGATVGFDYERGIRVVRGGKVPQTDAQLVPTLPGRFNFVLRWTAPNTDINLGVTQPALVPGGPTETLYPLAGYNVTSTGGTIPFDHRGGPSGGIEIGYWPVSAPAGAYLVGAQHISGSPTPATLDVFLDGQRVPIQVGRDVNGNPLTETTVSREVGPIDPTIADGVFFGRAQLSQPLTGATPAKSAKAAKSMGPQPARASQAVPAAKPIKR